MGGMAAAAATLTAHTLSFDNITMPFTHSSSQASGATLEAISARAVADSCRRPAHSTLDALHALPAHPSSVAAHASGSFWTLHHDNPPSMYKNPEVACWQTWRRVSFTRP